MGEDTTAQELGGPRVHGRNGVCDFTVANDVDAIFLARQLLTYLPASAGEHLPLAEPLDPAGEEDPGDVVPLSGRKVYDVRAVIDSIADAGSVLEASPKWAPNIVTAFARIEGGPVGIVANQPRYLGGVIDTAASEKATLFVELCDRFGLPLVVLVDTPGFMPGIRQEREGVIRRGASLLRAFAAARVPKLTVILRKAFGGAVITMNSRDLGADLTLAWSSAELGIMGARQAVGVVHRRELAAAEDPEALLTKLADDYAARHLTARSAARSGHVDEVIRPGETRGRVGAALSALASRKGGCGNVRNIPL
jgi:acetyl-CoA carboxylase carboxyltransferase component